MNQLDKRIVELLTSNSRRSIRDIAKKLKKPVSTVHLRTQKLFQEKITSSILINETLLGYSVSQLFLKVRIDDSYQNKVNQLIKSKNLIWLVKTAGSYNLIAEMFAQDIEEHERLSSQISSIFGKSLIHKKLCIPRQQYKFTNALSYMKEAKVSWNTSYSNVCKEFSLDKEDKLILQSIKWNARKPIVDIAKETNIPADVIMYRLKRFLKRGIIHQFTILPNFEELNYSSYIILVHLRSNPDEHKKIQQKIIRNGNIRYVVRHVGSNALYLHVYFHDTKEVFSLLDGLTQDFSDEITSYEIYPELERLYENLLPNCLLE